MKRTTLFLKITTLALLWALSACQAAPAPELSAGQARPVSTGSPDAPQASEALNSILWMQSAAEYRAICQILFDGARKALDQALQDPAWSAAPEQSGSPQALPPAIILDIDETVLDNSQFYARLAREHSGFDFSLWKQWVEGAEAPPIPAAADFVFYAAGKGVQIFYVTNRDADMEPATRRNLSQLKVNLPIDVDTVLMNGEQPGWTADKSSRRAFIAQNYRVLLLVGDDLGDFVSGAKDTLENRARLMAQYHSQWGRGWFLLPNPMYGSWESALYGYNSSLSAAEILGQKIAALQPFGAPASPDATAQASSVVPDATVTFTGDECLYAGPQKVYAGKLTLSIENKDEKSSTYGLFLGTMEPGKSMEDLIDWESLDQPPWMKAVDWRTVPPGSPTRMTPIVSKGPLYLVCFRSKPDKIIGRLGPIEVIQ